MILRVKKCGQMTTVQSEKVKTECLTSARWCCRNSEESTRTAMW